MIAAFRKNFPAAPCECAAAEDSSFFHRSFDAIVSWDLMFLLDESTQHRVIAKAATALNPGGLFLFTAPQQPHSWSDAMTDLPSRSLGYDAYHSACESVGVTLIPAPHPTLVATTTTLRREPHPVSLQPTAPRYETRRARCQSPPAGRRLRMKANPSVRRGGA